MATPRGRKRGGSAEPAAKAALRDFHPIVREWFTDTLGAPSAPQLGGWPAIASGENALILAPTGTGKTLAAFLWELNPLIIDGLERPLANAIHILYISPLKALNNDIQRNLERPLAELRERFIADGEEFPEIRVAVRTGDTPASARARMMRKTPHILITTPESLHIMLTSLRGRGMFSARSRGDRRRDPRDGRHEARRAPRAHARASRAPRRAPAAAHRPVGHAASARGDRAVLVGSVTVSAAMPIVDCGLVKQTRDWRSSRRSRI